MLSVYDGMKSQSVRQLLAVTVATVQYHNADMQLYSSIHQGKVI